MSVLEREAAALRVCKEIAASDKEHQSLVHNMITGLFIRELFIDEEAARAIVRVIAQHKSELLTINY